MSTQKELQTAHAVATLAEEPEGLDEKSKELDMRDYPLDSLLIRYEPRSVHEVCRRIEKNNYIMDPDFQRDFIWPLEKQSRLIESLLMRIPLPVFYLAERNDGKVIVIDGLQRLTTIYRFLNNEFALRRLDEANEAFKGKRFDSLSPKLQNRIEDTQLILYILDEKVPERARLDIFERVNGGTPLSRQQMRNCMYSGPATKLLANLAKSEEFLQATGRSLNWRTMRDRELVNRFMAFSVLGPDKYKGDMDQFLADVLTTMNAASREHQSKICKLFLTSMRNNYKIWGKHTFRKHEPEQEGRNVINAALFDVLSTLLAGAELNEKNREIFRAVFFDLQKNQDFQNAITRSTNDLRQVKSRFALAKEAFKGLV